MRNMTRRRALMINSSQSQSNVPREYREVKWLRGTGTQYCRTSYAPHVIQGDYRNSSIRGSLTVLNRNASKLAILADDMYGGTVNGHTRLGIKINNQTFSFDYGFQPDNKEKSYSLSDYGTENIELAYELNRVNTNYSMVLNETTFTAYAGNMASFNAYLIGAYYTGLEQITVLNQDVLIKKLSIYEGDNLISEIIPCYRKSDNKAGFYETGTELFLTNQGSGSDWLIGPNL